MVLRGLRRWVRDFEQVRVPEAPGTGTGTGLRERGRYLVTGGLGGVGITLAEDLGRRVRARLVLMGRTGLPDRSEWAQHLAEHGAEGRSGRAIRAIERIEAAGGEVLVVAADVTDPAALAGARKEVEAAFGGLDGIVHAAGLPSGSMIEVADLEVVRDVLAPKLSGTLALRQVFGDVPLDFVALCGSVTGVAGGLGQVDYCAANAFLDAYARSTHGWQTRVVSLDWGGWLEVGMAAETAVPEALRALRDLPDGPGDSPEAHSDGEPLDHPVLTRRTPRGCSGTVSAATHWLLDEHRINGVPVIPGTGHLEMARAAVVATLPQPEPGSILELRDVSFLRPFAVPDGRDARYIVEVEPDDDGVGFAVVDGQGDRYVTGSGGWTRPAATEAPVPPFTGSAPPAPGVGRSGVVSFGPRWDALAAHHVGDGEELAEVAGGDLVADDQGCWGLHPALLDVATAFGAQRGSGSYLPLAYGRVTIHDSLPSRFTSHLRYLDGDDSMVTADLTLRDVDGRVLVEIEEFALRRIDASAVSADLGGTPAPAVAPVAPAGRATRKEGIAPTDGAEAFRRVLAHDRLGPQVVVHTRTVAALLDDVRRVDVSEDARAAAAAAPDVPVTEGDGVAPRTDLERVIAEVWRDILGVEVGVTDDFFDLGGNSLVAVQLIARTRKAVGVRVPMRSLFDAPTVAELATVVEGLRDGPEPAAVPEDPTGPTGPTTIPRLPRAAEPGAE